MFKLHTDELLPLEKRFITKSELRDFNKKGFIVSSFKHNCKHEYRERLSSLAQFSPQVHAEPPSEYTSVNEMTP